MRPEVTFEAKGQKSEVTENQYHCHVEKLTSLSGVHLFDFMLLIPASRMGPLVYTRLVVFTMPLDKLLGRLRQV